LPRESRNRRTAETSVDAPAGFGLAGEAGTGAGETSEARISGTLTLTYKRLPGNYERQVTSLQNQSHTGEKPIKIRRLNDYPVPPLVMNAPSAIAEPVDVDIQQQIRLSTQDSSVLPD
jgi:hypothetical protein